MSIAMSCDFELLGEETLLDVNGGGVTVAAAAKAVALISAGGSILCSFLGWNDAATACSTVSAVASTVALVSMFIPTP